MIYLDTSVALAHILSEDRVPPVAIWQETLVASRLLEYELWTRIHGLKLSASHEKPVRELLQRVSFVELAPAVLARALDPFPTPVRTLDALHLASAVFLQRMGQTIELATYDDRQIRAARRLGLPIRPL